MASSERTEQEPMQASAPESTDTEMYQVLEKDLLISSDYQAGLVRNVIQVLEVASGVESTRDVHNIQFKEPDEEEEEIRHTPGTRDEGRGRSILKKMTVNTSTGTILQQPHTIGDIPSGVGSPLAKHPGNREPSGDFSFRSGFQSQLQMFSIAHEEDIRLVHELEAVVPVCEAVIIKEAGMPDPAQAPRGDTNSVTSAEDRPTTVSGDRGPERTA